MDHPTSGLKEIIASSFTAHPALTAALSGTIFLSLFLSILPPLVLQRAIDALAAGKAESSLLLFWGLLYFILTALSGLSEGIRETLITMFGQAVTKRIRQAMAAKLSRLPPAFLPAGAKAAPPPFSSMMWTPWKTSSTPALSAWP